MHAGAAPPSNPSSPPPPPPPGDHERHEQPPHNYPHNHQPQHVEHQAKAEADAERRVSPLDYPRELLTDAPLERLSVPELRGFIELAGLSYGDILDKETFVGPACSAGSSPSSATATPTASKRAN